MTSPLFMVKEEILERLRKAVGSDAAFGHDELVPPPDTSLGDLAFGVFPLAKMLKKAPPAIAEELARDLEKQIASDKKPSLITKVQANGPYLNFWIDHRTLGHRTIREIRKAKRRYGERAQGLFPSVLPSVGQSAETTLETIRNLVPGRRIVRKISKFAEHGLRAARKSAGRVVSLPPRRPLVMIELGALNTHKEIHVGHLRNILLGRAAVFLRRALGEDVVTSAYPGDAGAHVAKTLWALEKFHRGEQLPANKGQYLGKIYTEASRYLADHPEVKGEIEEVQRLLESGDAHLTKLWKKTRSWSLQEFRDLYRELGVPIRRYYYESEEEGEGKRMVAELLQKGIAKKSEGATIIDLADEGLGAFLILKTDGSSLYATKDLALAKKKFSEYPLDLSIVVVDARQSLYFKQLFAALKKIGFEKSMVHLAYEFVTLKEGAMSSRLGNIVTYEDFRDEMIAKARAETVKRHPTWSGPRLQKTAKVIAFGGMAVGMLKQDNDRQIVFDMEEALSFEGLSGPYLQYTLARIRGIGRKAKRSSGSLLGATFAASEERQLIFDLARYPETLEGAALEYRPAKLLAYLFELAKHFAEFYERVPVLKAPERERAGRLALTNGVGTVIENGMRVLGIPIVEEM